MPPKPLHQTNGVATTLARGLVFLFSSAALLVGRPIAAQTPESTAIRSRTVEVNYRIAGAIEDAKAELWYTRDRCVTWQRYGVDEDGISPFVFTAPAEGLYGLTLVLMSKSGSQTTGGQDNASVPAPHDPPQRWVFIDYTPPLAQWDAVEPCEDFAARRIVHLRWTAYDDHFGPRPVALAYQSSVSGTWQTIDAAVPNTGRYDWKVPADVSGQVSVKLVVSDRGGHSVERIHGPVPTEHWTRTSAVSAPTTRPAMAAATRPAVDAGNSAVVGSPPAPVDIEKRLKAQNLHRQGAWHLKNGRYAIAAERFREALEADPDTLAAQCDLAGIYYLQQDYAKAAGAYNAALARDATYEPALRGAYLAFVALKQYPQSSEMLKRLLAIKEDDAQAWFDLGDVSFLMGDSAGARGHWTRATTVDAKAEAVILKARSRLESYGNTGTDPPAAGNK